MSVKAKLEVYELNIREKGKGKPYLSWDDIAGYSLLEEITTYLNKNIFLFKIDKESERTSRIEKVELLDNKLFCRVKVGKFGESSELVDTVSGSGVFHKEPEHSDTIPLFFSITTDSNRSATLIIERSGNKTLLPYIRKVLEMVLNSLREDLFTYKIIQKKETKTLNNILSSNPSMLKSMELILKNSEDSDLLENPVVVIKPKLRKVFRSETIASLIAFKGQYTDIIKTLPTYFSAEQIENIKLRIKLEDGSKAELKLGNKLEINNNIVLETSSSDLDKFGHPSYNFLKSYCNSL